MAVREITKQVAGIEDFTTGEGSVTQERNGTNYSITKVGAASLPYDDTGIAGTHGSIKDHFMNGITNTSLPPYNAVGDKVADDTAALQAAFDVGGPIVIPKGDYLVTGLRINVAAEIKCFGTIWLADNSNAHVVRITASDVTIDGLTIDGNGANQTTLGHGLVCVYTDNITFKNCTVRNTLLNGIYSLDTSYLVVDSCTVIDSGQIGIFCQSTLSDGKCVQVTNCVVDRSALGPGLRSGGIFVRGNNISGPFTQSIQTVAGNRVILPSDPTDVESICIELHGYANQTAVTGNTTQGGSMGISIDESSTVAVSGNSINDVNKYGIESAGSTECSITGNTINGQSRGSQSIGIITSKPGSTQNVISGNVITGMTESGIQISATNDNCLISSNNITHAGSLYAIWVQNSDYSVVSSNIVNGVSAGHSGICINNSSFSTVSGNLIRNFANNGVLLLAASGAVESIAVNGNTFISNPTWLNATATGGTLGFFLTAEGNISNGTIWDYLDILNNVREYTSFGTPEGNHVGGVGSVFHRRNGGAGTCLYVKESGTGNTGWVAK